MNKFILPAFAVFALLACSEEEKPAPSHYEICAKKTTRECLVGRWLPETVEGTPTCTSNRYPDGLKLESNGRFSFRGGYTSGFNPMMEGNWELDEKGTTMTINITGGDYDYESFSSTIEVRNSGNELRITSSNKYSTFLRCGEGKYTEIFSWQGFD